MARELELHADSVFGPALLTPGITIGRKVCPAQRSHVALRERVLLPALDTLQIPVGVCFRLLNSRPYRSSASASVVFSASRLSR